MSRRLLNPRSHNQRCDITEKKQAEEEMQKQATVDMLTGTFNRRTGIIWLEKHMKLVTRSNSVVTICYLDVNDLKHVNDTYGHDEGDSLIKVVVATVQKFLRGSDIICRLGGDEFLRFIRLKRTFCQFLLLQGFRT